MSGGPTSKGGRTAVQLQVKRQLTVLLFTLPWGMGRVLLLALGLFRWIV